MKISDHVRLFVAKYKSLRGEPPCNGSFLVQDADGLIYFEFRMADAPGRREIVYWKRANMPLPAPREYLSYNVKARLADGHQVPYVKEFR